MSLYQQKRRSGAKKNLFAKNPGMSRILLVEDEPAILESLSYVLERDGLIPFQAPSLQVAQKHLQEQMLDLLLIDLMLPDGSGFDLIAQLRRNGQTHPALIVLSSRDSESDRVRALEMGADDYVTKPFSPREVLARVHAVLRRTLNSPDSQPEPRTALQLNLVSRKVSFQQTTLDLTRVEFDLLALLISETDKAFSRAEIIDRVWGPGFALSDRTIDSHIKALRKKLVEAGGQADWIETVRGIGYRLMHEALLP